MRRQEKQADSRDTPRNTCSQRRRCEHAGKRCRTDCVRGTRRSAIDCSLGAGRRRKLRSRKVRGYQGILDSAASESSTGQFCISSGPCRCFDGGECCGSLSGGTRSGEPSYEPLRRRGLTPPHFLRVHTTGTRSTAYCGLVKARHRSLLACSLHVGRMIRAKADGSIYRMLCHFYHALCKDEGEDAIDLRA